MIKRIFHSTGLGALVIIGVVCAFWWQFVEQAVAISRQSLFGPENIEIRSGLKPGLPVYVRIFKQESELELWMLKGERWQHYHTFPICSWSGQLGPKLKEGDGQSPEGFYEVSKSGLNPNSSYHLSFNLGFPNVYDRSLGRTGSFLMVHGNCVSIGCYAMTNPGIDLIYGMVEAALNAGQKRVPVHIYPFRMSDAQMARNRQSQWLGFWRELKPAFEVFEASGQLPQIKVLQKQYVVKDSN